jgi:hypothetical protein
VEALHAGGVGRFINDCWGRAEGAATVNVEPRAVWDAVQSVPVIIMVATKRIGANEELVSDYGPAFWKIVWRDLRVLQTEFWRRCSARVSYLERRLKDAGVPLPRLPEPLAGPLFIGAVPTIDAALDDGEDADDAGSESDGAGGAGAGAGGSARRRGAAAASSLAAALTGDS